MQQLPLEGDVVPRVVQALGQSPLFSALSPEVLAQVTQRAALFTAAPGEVILTEGGGPADTFYVVLAGEVAVQVKGATGELIEVTRLRPPESVGEMGLLLDRPRTATVVAIGKALLLQFEKQAFMILYERIPGFGLGISRALAARLHSASRQIPMPEHNDGGATGAELPDQEVVALLPLDFIERHRVLPVRQEGHTLSVGFVDDPSSHVLSAARALLPGMELRPVRIGVGLFDKVLAQFAGVGGWSKPADHRAEQPDERAADGDDVKPRSSPRLDRLLRRMVAEGCSDLHLSGGQRPRWRIDGEIHTINDAPPLSNREVFELLEPVMDARNKDQYEADNDTDFAYAIEGLARFRVNLFRDKGGVSAVFRQIPAKVLTFEQLNLPPVARVLCENPKGLVLVTGPTGSGKSTTLAAMIDFINKNRKSHIITLEDPIEFVHHSQQCLINQREVGPHTKSFHRALKAALREDPDIVLVGEMRDLETVSLAMETANTGHLVFGTLHTATAISTVDRIIDLFPPEQQSQVRSVLSETLKGVIAQTLCRKIGGGRVAALETLVVTFAIANLIREGKTHQMVSAMATSKSLGNVLLNEALAALVLDGRVDFAEALTKAIDKPDLARRCNKQLPPTLGGREEPEPTTPERRAAGERRPGGPENAERPERPVRRPQP